MKRLAAILLALSACSPARLPDLAPGERPASDSEEAGLWMEADRAEDAIRTSPLRVQDAALVAYIQGIVDRVAGPRAKDLRVYVLQIPEFNAFAFPNGALVVLTGLILRAENESQLAFVLSHEITHYSRRHGVLLFLNARSKASFAAFFQAFASAALVGEVGALAGTLALGSTFRFSRDMERDADDGGVDLMVRGGYDARESSRICEICLLETESAGRKESASFFASHPTTRERVGTLSERAAKFPATSGQTPPDRHAQVLEPLRLTFLCDELQRQDPAGLQVLLDRLLRAEPNSGELHYIQGESFRLRRGKDDAERAISAYQRAVANPPTPPEAHQRMGILYLKKGEKEKARTSFLRYLEVRPKAEDAEMVRSYLKQLE